ncbi:MAG: KUP/HAK/KT family potassium transporter [Candidatus Nanopelagicales bacterium]
MIKKPSSETSTNGTVAKRTGLPLLTLGALGIVFGDIGTSPLYAFSEIFGNSHSIPVNESRVMGAASLVFWTLTMIVSVKYVLVVMRADNKGEGGIMALASLAAGPKFHIAKAKNWILTAGILGAALFYGDGMITPAVSVLSAVEGLELVNPSFGNWVVPIAVVILLILFMVQRFGTHIIGKAFGPVMLVWFVAIGLLGLVSVIGNPEVIQAINPMHAVNFFLGETWIAFLALGSVVLCVTGAEALYADMGQFGAKPIRISWFAIAVPALYLNYFGQAALAIRNPEAVDSSFYSLVPASMQLIMVILATVATVIASQAVISGAFSMTRQAIHLGYLPKLQIRHTSDTERGQVYIPAVNWALMVFVIGLVVAFRDSSNLSSAYGIAVTATFVVTTTLITVVAVKRWKLSLWIVIPMSTVFLVIDLAFFASNLTKFGHGGWFPILIAGIIFVLLGTWAKGNRLLRKAIASKNPSLQDFAHQVEVQNLPTTPTTEVFITQFEVATPPALVEQVAKMSSVAGNSIILTVKTANRPWMPRENRLEVSQLSPHFTQVIVTYGFMDKVDLADDLTLMDELGVTVDPSTTTWVVFVPAIKPGKSKLMPRPQQILFDYLSRLAPNQEFYWNTPRAQTVQLGNVINLDDAKNYKPRSRS